jgi:hypothetical protein
MVHVANKSKKTVDYGEEHLSQIIPHSESEKVTSKMYKSKFRKQVASDNKFEKFANKTMGPAKVNVRTPENFLKKSDGSTAQMPRPPNSLNKYNCDSGFNSFERNFYGDAIKSLPNKPNLPNKNNNQCKMTSKDFIKANAVENITSVSRKAKEIYVDTNTGHKNDLITSGLVPRHTLKEDFGQVPNYLQNKKAIIQQAQEEYDQYVSMKIRQESLDRISPEQKQEILCGLKAKWEELHHQYQGISVVTDTAPKKNRKERLEASMSGLERDISLLEGSTVYVAK